MLRLKVEAVCHSSRPHGIVVLLSQGVDTKSAWFNLNDLPSLVESHAFAGYCKLSLDDVQPFGVNLGKRQPAQSTSMVIRLYHDQWITDVCKAALSISVHGALNSLSVDFLEAYGVHHGQATCQGRKLMSLPRSASPSGCLL